MTRLSPLRDVFEAEADARRQASELADEPGAWTAAFAARHRTRVALVNHQLAHGHR